jgi:glycosyltransferase involved in cell wall biosynthesis
VHFVGHVDMPMRYFRAFELAIFPSTYVGETFPMFLMESLAAGLPIVATDIGEIPRILGPSETRPGALVSHKLPSEQMAEEMAETIASYVRDEEKLAKLRGLTAGVSAKFSMTKLVELYMRAGKMRKPLVERE